MDGRPNTKKIKAQNYNGFSFERISFDWANDLNENNNRWANFNISLSKPKFKNIELDAIRISIVRNRDNRGERIFMRLEERNCFPNCIGGPLPRSAFRDNKSKNLSVNYLISGATDHKESRQWYDLSKESKEFVAELVMAIPQMLTEMKKGRHWKNRNGINKFDGWKPVFKQIELRLPKSKYAKTAKNLPIKVYKSKNNNKEMMQMMSDLKSVTTLKMHCRNSRDVSWTNYIDDNHLKKTAELLLAHKGLKVITNNVNIVNIFSHSDDAKVWLAGGKVRKADSAVIGEDPTYFIRQFKVDYAVVGVAAIGNDGLLMDFDRSEGIVSRAIFQRCLKLILVADDT